MRKLLPLALLFWLLTPNLLQAENVSEAAFWQLITDLDAELGLDLPADQLLDQIAAVDSVTIADGTQVEIDTSALISQLETFESSADQMRLLKQLLDTRDLSSAQPQNESPSVLDSVLARPEFQYSVEESWRQRAWRQIQEWFFAILRQSQIGNAGVGYVIGGIAGLALALFLVYWLRGLRRQFSAESALPFSDEADYRLSANDALQRAQQQASAGDYREAVRYLYLSTLFSLDESDQLRFDRSKTNREYLRQVSGTAVAPKLSSVVDVFDRVWYGFQPIDSATYQHYETQVKELVQ